MAMAWVRDPLLRRCAGVVLALGAANAWALDALDAEAPVAPLIRPILPGLAPALPTPTAIPPAASTAHALTARAAMPFALASTALAPVAVAIDGNTAVATLALPQGIDAELTLTFDQPLNLGADALGISAQVVNPLDLTLLARLPSGTLSIPDAFPVLVTVEPPAGGGLAFRNATTVEIHTHALPYAADSPLRLYKAPLGGAFYDITDAVNPGSVRTRGQTGGFSQFLVLVDLTDAHEIAEDKYSYLQARLANPAIDAAARTALAPELAASRSAFLAGDFAGAAAHLSSFRALVQSYAGSGVPNRWRAARDLDNLAGDLLGEAASLGFTLGRLAGS